MNTGTDDQIEAQIVSSGIHSTCDSGIERIARHFQYLSTPDQTSVPVFMLKIQHLRGMNRQFQYQMPIGRLSSGTVRNPDKV